jgi:DNA primase
MRQENLEFGEALRSLAQRAGVILEPLREEAKAEASLKDRLRKMNTLAAEYFHYLILHSPEGAKARDYLVKRGISDETRDGFQLGYAKEEWQALGNQLTSKGYSWSNLQEAGLVVEREGGGYYDRFRGRLIFPIRDVAGYVVGFGARALGDDVPKYLNSPQTAIFDKSAGLYGIDQAKTAIREQGLVVIVEGYMDVLMAHQHGRRNVVASMGTALTEKQIRVIKKLTKSLVLALDPDAAGDKATLRGLEMAQDAFDKRAVPVPTWRGLIRYEDQLDAEIRVATLPSGRDPDEVIREDAALWDDLVSQALPVVEYYLKSVISGFDLSSPKAKVEAARQVLPLIREIGSSVERSHYLQKLARMLRIDERVLQQEMQSLAIFLARQSKKAQQTPQAAGDRHGRLSAQSGLMFGPELYVLLLILRQPSLLASMNGLLARLELDSLNAEDFVAQEERALFVTMGGLVPTEKEVGWDLHLLRQKVEPSLHPKLEQLLALMENLAFLSDEQAEMDAAACALRLRELRLRRQGEELGYLQEDARAQGDSDAIRQWGGLVNGLAKQLARLQREKASQTSLRSVR